METTTIRGQQRNSERAEILLLLHRLIDLMEMEQVDRMPPGRAPEMVPMRPQLVERKSA